jgi:hypothetical protein
MVAFCLSNWKKVTNLLKMVAIRVKAVAFVLKKPTSVQSLSGRRVVRGVGKQRGSRANLRCTRHFRSFLSVDLTSNDGIPSEECDKFRSRVGEFLGGFSVINAGDLVE